MKPKIIWPLAGKFPITFRFGEAPAWYTRIFGYPHNGLDIACPSGTPVMVCDEGTISFADDIPDQSGCGIIIKHDWGISLYWHLSQLTAKVGDKVKKGDIIGQSGATGYVTGPHLHFGTKLHGVDVPGMRGWSDPLKYLTTEIEVPTPPAPVIRRHLVFPGETLWKIAEKYYGNGLEWRRIYEANRDKIFNPNLIFPFQRLLIP